MDETNATLTVVSKHGARYRVVQVEVDGKVVGYLVGRTEGLSKHRWWANYVSASGSFPMTETSALVYGVRDRAIALDNLLFNARREGLL
jgi:hypothetical protein